MIQKNKTEWLDCVLNLRDNFVHYSNLNDYKDFSIILNSSKRIVIKDLNDFERPHIIIASEKINALDFLKQTHARLKLFINRLLIEFGFDKYQRPDFATTCNKCGFQFADLKEINSKRTLVIIKPFPIKIFNLEYEHGLIACPNCDKEFEVSLKELKEFGFDINKGTFD